MKRIVELISLLIGGLGIGWLAGLSITPVIQIILTGIISLIAGVTAIIMGFYPNEITVIKSKGVHSSLPVVLLIVGISVGAPIGIYARTNSWLAEKPEHLLTSLEQFGISSDSAKLYLKEYELQKLRENINIHLIGKTKANTPTGEINQGMNSLAGLLNHDDSLCNLIVLAHGKILRNILSNQNNKTIRELTKICKDDSSLEKLKDILCER